MGNHDVPCGKCGLDLRIHRHNEDTCPGPEPKAAPKPKQVDGRTKLEQVRELAAEAAKVTRSADLCYRAAANAMASDAVRQYAALLDVVEAAITFMKSEPDRLSYEKDLLALGKAVRKWEDLA